MDRHYPNTPRERDGQGKKVDEPTQCSVCLQAWPCESERRDVEIARLRGVIYTKDVSIRALNEEIARLEREVVKDPLP